MDTMINDGNENNNSICFTTNHIIQTQLIPLCHNFLIYINRLYDKGLISHEQFQVMSKIKIQFIEKYENVSL